MKVVAFDIDGALTQQKGMQIFNQVRSRREVKIGVVTARPKRSMNNFISKTNLQVDFKKSSRLKGRAFRQIENDIPADSYKYYGSNILDRFFAVTNGWEYEQI